MQPADRHWLLIDSLRRRFDLSRWKFHRLTPGKNSS